ncbi:fibronectin type III-like domain-contianing protein [Gillisia hiemivivida]|uniref:Fibronectin type III-like domain-containing protein n=1 Tax=Gillisia hiemivivida TaxID=291190 RepID=A0A5C6ZSB7_9FLAO|nr:hypothetical protein ES724_08780 [Gillisia hiemivivida]
MIKPGESKGVFFNLSFKDFSYYISNMSFKAELGDFKLFVGTNSVSNLKS